MRVLVLPADNSGCGMYRMAWPAQYLKHIGHDVEICYWGQRGIFEIHSSDGVHIDGITMPKGVDVVVVQRVSSRVHAQVFRELRARGIAVVMDMDDDLGKVHKSHAAFGVYNSKGSRHTPENVAYAANEATMVTVTTPALLRTYARHGRGAIIDNYVCGSDLEIEHTDSGVMGWAGDTKTRADDWQVVGNALRRLVSAGHQFIAVGPEGDLGQQLKLPTEPRYTGYVPIMDWMRAMSKIGVGLAPLFPSAFNRAKSRLKVAQMAALGIPWVGSPLPEYTRFHQESGTGILASNPREWHDGLLSLISDPDLRAEMGEKGRAHMADQTIEANAWRWWDAWTKALEFERA